MRETVSTTISRRRRSRYERALRGKVVLITGGSRGIGRELAQLCGRAGATVVICGRDGRRATATAELLRAGGSAVEGYRVDVGDPDACRALVETVVAGHGGIDVLIHNAGLSMRGAVEQTAPLVYQQMAAVNFLGPAYLTHYALPALRARRGGIVFVSTLAALRGLPLVAAYGASKAAVASLGQSLRAELQGSGVHVGVVYVGFTDNDADKQILAADGRAVPLPPRRNSHSQVQAAAGILDCLVRRRGSHVLTAVGRITAFVYRLFPGLADAVVARAAVRSGRYGRT